MSALRDRTYKNVPSWLVDMRGVAGLVERCGKTPSNSGEALVYQKLIERGATVMRRGWPDFAVFENGSFYAVEVKQKGDVLSTEQQVILRALADEGIDTYVWQRDHFEAIGDSIEWPDR
jgi:hypothetical protein